MTPSEKHLETALGLISSQCGGDDLCTRGPCGCQDMIARALAQAELDGMKRAAEICELRAAQWGAHVDGRIPAFLSSYRQRRMADEARFIRRLILSETGEE